MPGGARWSWQDLAVDRLHALDADDGDRVADDAAPCARCLVAVARTAASRRWRRRALARRHGARRRRRLSPGAEAPESLEPFASKRRARHTTRSPPSATATSSRRVCRARRAAARDVPRRPRRSPTGCSPRLSRQRRCARRTSQRRQRGSARSRSIARAGPATAADARSPARFARELRRLVGEFQARWRRRVPGHRRSRSERGARRSRTHRRALRPRRAAAGRRGASSTSASWRIGWRRTRDGWQIVEWTASAHRDAAARRQPIFTEVTAGGARRQRGVPPSAEHAARRLDGDARLGADARLERPPRRLGRRRRRRRPRGSRTWRSRPACPTGCSARGATATFEDVDRRAGARRARRHGAVAVRRRRQRRRPGPRARHRHAAAAVRSTTARAASRRSPTPSASTRRCRASLTGDLDGRLRSRRLPRRLPLRLLVLLRRRRGQGRHADAVPRRPQRPARRAVPQRRPRPLRRRHGEARARRRQRPLPLRRGVGRLRRATAGPTCWSPTTSAPRTSTATSARAAARSASRTSRRRPASSTTAPA